MPGPLHPYGTRPDLPAKASFIVRSSWGTRWGLAGYFLLPYAFVLSDKQHAWDFWVITGLTAAPAVPRR